MKAPRMIDVAAHQRAAPVRATPTPPMPDTGDIPILSGSAVPPPGAMGPPMPMGPQVPGRAPAIFRPHNIRRGYA